MKFPTTIGGLLLQLGMLPPTKESSTELYGGSELPIAEDPRIPCHYCGSLEWEILRGDEAHPGYAGYPYTSCCRAV